MLIRLDSAAAQGNPPFSHPHTGLFHNAFRYPDRGALRAAVRRTVELAPVFEGASDHGVSDAVYFRDPEGNGVELYRDRPYEEWPVAGEGKVGMYTRPLDLAALVGEGVDDGLPTRCDIGHIHLQTADVEATAGFWRDVFGLDERQRFGPQAVFLAEGFTTITSAPTPGTRWGPSRLRPIGRGWTRSSSALRSAERVDAASARLEEAGVKVVTDSGHVTFEDPDSNRVLIQAAEGTPWRRRPAGRYEPVRDVRQGLAVPAGPRADRPRRRRRGSMVVT